MGKVYIAKYETMEDSETIGIFLSLDGAQKACRERIALHTQDRDKQDLHLKEKYGRGLPDEQWEEIPDPVYRLECRDWSSSSNCWFDTGRCILVEIWDLHP